MADVEKIVQFSSTDQKFDLTFGSSGKKFGLTFENVVMVDREHKSYEGEYLVTPSTIDDVTLETIDLYMKKNVVVVKIPYAEVTNGANGKTATIG